MRNTNQRKEHGIALLLSILALLLLSAVAVGMIYMATTENSIAANFKSEETTYFAARAGIEEVRDRMIPASGVAPYGTTPYNINALLPTQLPGSANQGIIYILQNNPSNAMSMTNVTNGTPSTNQFFDDELCHDFAIGGMSRSTTANVRCTTLPSGSGWYKTLTSAQGGFSQAPTWTSGGTSNPLDWKWTRISLKAANSTPYCLDGKTGTNCYSDATQAAQIACYDGTSEKPVASTSNCASIGANPVYLLTSLAVSATGTRRVVQAEIAQTPLNSNQPAGLFATGTGCGASNPLTFGGNVTTGSFDSTTENPPNSFPTLSLSGGDVGANGGVTIGGTSAQINGNVASTLPSGTTGCPLAITQNGTPTIGGETQIPTAYTPTTPSTPANVPQTSCTVANKCITTNQTCNKNGKNCSVTGYSLSPGTYGNISIGSSTLLTLQSGTTGAPAVYSINSLSEAGQASIRLSGPPFGPVVINIAGAGQTTVLDLTAGGFANNSNVASNLTFNYGGTATIAMTGGSAAFFVLNAPKANLKLTGNQTFYGSAVAQTIDVQGSSTFYWDKATVPPPTTNTNPYNIIAMRELSY
jgi:hypothetical protein